MFDIMTAFDAKQRALSSVEKFFNEHPEYDLLLQKFDDIVAHNTVRLVRLDGLQMNFIAEDSDFCLEEYVQIKPIKKTKIVREEIPVYKKTMTGKEKLDHYEYKDKEVEYVEELVDKKDVIELGKMFIALLKLKGYEIIHVEYQGGDTEDRVRCCTINLGGLDGTQ